MQRFYLVLLVAGIAACDAKPINAPVSEKSPAAYVGATIATAHSVVDNGDGTSTLTFQPGPGRNDGTDEGTADAGKDAFVLVNQNGPIGSGNSPRAHHFYSSCNSWNAHSYYRFDVAGLPDAADVISVRLALYHTLLSSYWRGWDAAVTTFTLFRVTSPWQENTVTWGAQPALGPAIAGSAMNSSVGIPVDGGTHRMYFDGWADMDITDEYGSWQSGAVPNHGVAYKRDQRWCENTNGTFVAQSDMEDDFASWLSTRAAFRPKLVIQYRSAPANQPPTAAITGPSGVNEGSAITLTGLATDPDGDVAAVIASPLITSNLSSSPVSSSRARGFDTVLPVRTSFT